MTGIRPIPTKYTGVRFRSRLEARWAVFFDTLRVKWLYEPQGFMVGPDGHLRPYLPDFHLPESNIWAEVKGSDTDMDWSLVGDAYYDADDCSHLPVSNGLLVLGNIPDTSHSYATPWHPMLSSAFFVDDDQDEDSPLSWSGTYGVTVEGVCFSGQAAIPGMVTTVNRNNLYLGNRLSTGSGVPFKWKTSCSVHGGIEYTKENLNPKVRSAYNAARSARFEHGQSGAT